MRPLSVLATMLVLLACFATPASATPTAQCSQTSTPVSSGLFQYTVHGQLCLPSDSTPSTVQLLLHGATYNSAYWDLPYQPDQYSYQRDMAVHGLATFAMDEIGVGQSSRPLSTLVSGTLQASVVHQVVTSLRTQFTRVVLVGHSAGSGIAMMEASTYNDVDGVVVTGATHVPNAPIVIQDVVLGLHPVTLDPQLSSRGGDPGYLTTVPGSRGQMYYAPGDLDPQAVAADEAFAKDQVSTTSLTDIITIGLASPVSLNITVPVLMVLGTNDTGFCGVFRDCSSADALRAQEAPYFSPAAQLAVSVLPGSGHSVALAVNSADYRDTTRAWLQQHGCG
ncbi:alpha/beta fold hydrolase [Kutzneria viridogrisea]|uniref:AB hydrolase-1 domain-containing protein n=2 Tax=Kutzneria TaxID=43356 RepID=W5W333_9PSEU|nr:alpha/beta hydrolase [Kutzneria albida]AHH95613.1 hypothetical protein KALB_2244 [Kutzneria albida DSM 43870]MBA8927024.1 pimeloyl-ACP methyl ester carboxylesterase [Kutzneria viridogrisea]